MFGGISRVLLGCKYFKEALLSTDYPLNSFCPQICTDQHRFFNIKDILIITDFILHSISRRPFFIVLARKSTALFIIKARLGSAQRLSRHFVVTACFASSRLSLLCALTSRVYTLVQPLANIAFTHRAAQPCLF